LPSERMHEPNLHVVLGTGPLGLAVARHVASRGERVRVAVRGGRADLPQGVAVSAPTSPSRPTRSGQSKEQVMDRVKQGWSASTPGRDTTTLC